MVVKLYNFWLGDQYFKESTIRVSLEPPPLELLTIVLPFLRATRVNPPIVTYVSFPDNIKGLRS